MKNFLAWAKAVWSKYHNNPWVVTAYSSAAGVLIPALYSEYQSGHVDLSKAGITHLLSVAGGVVLTNLYHLYVQPKPSEGPDAK